MNARKKILAAILIGLGLTAAGSIAASAATSSHATPAAMYYHD